MINDVYISSDADDISEISKNYGAKVIKRPRTIAGDNSKFEETLKYRIAFIKKYKRKNRYSNFFQATFTLRASEDISNVIKFFISTQADSLFSTAILEDFCIRRKQKKN